MNKLFQKAGTEEGAEGRRDLERAGGWVGMKPGEAARGMALALR